MLLTKNHSYSKKAFVFAIVAISYYFSALLGNYFSIPPGIITPIWPASGVKLACVLIWGYGVWPAIYVAGVLYELTVYGHVTLYPIINSMLIAVGQTLEPVVGAWLLNRFTQGNFSFGHVYHVFLFLLLAAIIAPFINATIGSIIYYQSGNLHANQAYGFYINWFNWWLNDAVGIIIFTPAILAWLKLKNTFSLKINYELILYFFLLFLTAGLVFFLDYPLNFLFIPFCIWVALRFGLQISTLTSLLISVILIFDTMYGRNELYVASTQLTFILVQGFASMVCIIVLTLSAVLSEREEAYTELRLINSELEQRVLRRTQDLADKNNALNQALSDLKKTQARLVQSEKMSSVGILVAGVAHEINNTVNFISANLHPLKQDIDDILQVLNKYAELDDKTSLEQHLQEVIKLKNQLDLNYTLNEVQQLLLAMEDGTQRTTTIVKDLRTFSRLDENDIKIINIWDNIDATLTLLKSQLKDIKIIKKNANVPDIECYPGKLNQVFMNLLTNAAQAIKQEGVIIISTYAEKEFIIISIKDNGSGMPPDVLDKIFEPFYTTKDVGQGTGLGLWISYDIIQAHHGSIEVKSTLNNGSEFIITLPIKQIPRAC